MEPLRVGIMGLGRSGWDIHARLIDPLKDKYQIVAVVDRLPERRAEAVERWGCSAYPEVEELLANDDIELVIVALPSYLHAGVSIAALEAGKHVVCEKPMATSLEDADAMVAADQAAETVLSIFQNRRYNPDFVKVQEIIDSGILGRIVQIRLSESKFGRRWDWQTQKQFGGGTLNNTGPHHLDMALQLFGPTEPEISVHLDRTLTLGDADDHVSWVLTGRRPADHRHRSQQRLRLPRRNLEHHGHPGRPGRHDQGTALEVLRIRSNCGPASWTSRPRPTAATTASRFPAQEGVGASRRIPVQDTQATTLLSLIKSCTLTVS